MLQYLVCNAVFAALFLREERKPGKGKNVKREKCIVKKFSVFLDVFQNGSIYKVKGTKDFLSAAYSYKF